MHLTLATLLVQNRRALSWGIALSTLAAVWVAMGLKFDFTPQALFAGRDDLLELNERVKETFGHSENVLLVVQQSVGSHDLLEPSALQWHRELCSRLAALPYVDQLHAIGTLEVPRFRILGGFLTGSPLVMVPLLASGAIDAERADQVRQRVDGQPMIDGVLVSRDRRTAAIALELSPERKDVAHLARVVDEVRQTVAEVACPTGYVTFLGGLPAMRVEIINGLKRDQATIIPVCVVVFALVEALIFRCWAGVAAPGLAIGVGMAWTLASLVLLDQSLTVISNVLPILLLIVGVSHCVHFLNAYAEQSERFPDDRVESVRQAASHMILACFLTSLTTALGFLSLLFAHSTVLGGFGWQAALGIGLFFLASILVCICTLPRFAPPRHRASTSSAPSCFAQFAWGIGRFSSSKPRRVVALGAWVMGSAALLASRVQIDSRLIETYDDDHVEVAQMRHIESELAGFMPMEIVLTGSTPDWYRRPAQWLQLREFVQSAAAHPDILLIRSPLDLFDQAEQLAPGGRRPRSEVVSSRSSALPETSAELGRRVERLGRALDKYGGQGDFGLQAFVAPDRKTIRVALRLKEISAQRNLRLATALQHDLDNAFPAEAGVRAEITGESYVAAVAMLGFIRDLLGSLAGVTALIFLVIGLLLGSLRMGLLSVLPNLAPLLVTVGYLVMRGYPLNVGNVIVFAISLGIAVDDTIHFLTRFQQEIASCRDVDEALRRVCLTSGRAIVTTTLLIVCGLSILLLSAFVPTRRFAELAAVTMIAALLGDLMLLPALLKLFWPQVRCDDRESNDRNAARERADSHTLVR